MRTRNKKVTAEALVRGKLPENLLSITSIINKLGSVMLDKHGAALILQKRHTKMRNEIHYFATRNKNFYYLNIKNSSICLGATEAVADDTISANETHKPIQTIDEQKSNEYNIKLEREAGKAAKKKTATLTLTPTKQRLLFDTGRQELPSQQKIARYEWHLVLNHASPELLTKLARNPSFKIPSLDSIKTTRNDTTCRGCY